MKSFNIGGTSPIKSIQRGYETFSSVNTKNITITGVNTAKSIIIHSVDTTSTDPSKCVCVSNFEDSTTISFTFGATVSCIVGWQVIEFI